MQERINHEEIGGEAVVANNIENNFGLDLARYREILENHLNNHHDPAVEEYEILSEFAHEIEKENEIKGLKLDQKIDGIPGVARILFTMLADSDSLDDVYHSRTDKEPVIH